MPAIPQGPLGRAETIQIAKFLSERLRKHVGLEVWTRVEGPLVANDRDRNTHADDALALMRQLATLSPALTVTPYDLDKFAERAAHDGITQTPTVVIRGSGRAIQTVGLFYGALFGPFMDIVSLASVGLTPVTPQTRTALGALTETVEVEAFLSPFDPMSPQMATLLGAFAVEAKRVRVRLVDASQFPVLSGQRLVTHVPVLWMNGRRFEGFWSEAHLAEQIGMIASGSPDIVVRDRILNAEYLSEDAAREIAARTAPDSTPAAPPTSSSGLILPGQT